MVAVSYTHLFPNEKVAFSYEVIGDYKVDYLVGSTIQFTNTSAEVGACVWDFGDGTDVYKRQRDGNGSKSRKEKT